MTSPVQLDRMAAALAGEHQPTLCKDCKWLVITNSKDHWVKWLCGAAKNYTISYMTGQLDPPLRFCRFVNFGDCEMYEVGVNPLSPDKLRGDGYGNFTRIEEE